MAFHGFFRLEEIVIKAKTQSDKIIQRSVVYLEAANGKLKKMQLVLRNFKKNSQLWPITIIRTNEESENIRSCTVFALFQ